jgi:lysyl-tRNA synthetase class 2
MKDVLYVLFSKLEDLHQRFPNRYIGDGDSRRLSDLKIHGFVLKKFSELEIIDLTPNWRRVKYRDLVCERIRSDWFDLTPEKRLLIADDMGIEITSKPIRKMKDLLGRPFRDLNTAEQNDWIDRMNLRVKYLEEGVQDFEVTGAVFEKMIEPRLIQPTFVTHLPKELVPLAKLTDVKPGDPDYESLKDTVEVFECCINGQEIAPAYSELNDPDEQRQRLLHQAGGEQQKLDEDFLVALEHGMPPAGGMGMGIDRLCMMLLGQESIRDVILFPQLKPK